MFSCNIKSNSMSIIVFFQFVCKACQLGKTHKLPFISLINKIEAPLEVIYLDIWDPLSLLSSLGFR